MHSKASSVAYKPEQNPLSVAFVANLTLRKKGGVHITPQKSE
jgi:hypothetical protein